MVQYRTQVKIIADVLVTARDMNTEGAGVGVTALVRKANMSYTRMSKLLSELVGSGLLLELDGEKISKYMISEKGKQFLVAYSSFQDFAQSFGLRL
ncbi:MAG: transcriptional regulator [Nitrososphaerota archaeon]|jgi:predicted transcriptional regulator|nr:transcriptional regulator [Nitrososphaerota archaeon]MDG6974675.1 transcriptional regulator [Nitrososphaerota archaeon]MDG7018641.1 transcriptional regulator [Nitrososphaerota archaeon]MDG7020079.1 transcriptional regulator [Nitrososphaerota archaeon]MDG7028276.1 transcriptional regulator [Nitrososphaerota archaeon]